MLLKERCHANFLAIPEFLKFPVIPDFFSRWHQDCKERPCIFRWRWSGHVLGCVRVRFNVLLWIKHPTKLLSHLLSIPAWLGSGMLQTHSPFSADTFPVPVSTTPSLEKYFQREASTQGKDSPENLLVLMNPDFLIENHFLFIWVGESPTAPGWTLVLCRVLILSLKNQLFISCSQCPRLRATFPPLGLLCPHSPGSTPRLLCVTSIPLLEKVFSHNPWCFTSSWRIGFKHSHWQMWRHLPNPSPETWEFKEFMAKLQQSYSSSWEKMLTRCFCFSSLILAPYVKNQGVKKQSLI